MEVWRQRNMRILVQASDQGVKAAFEYRTADGWALYRETEHMSMPTLWRILPGWKRTAVRDVRQFLAALEAAPENWP